MIRVKKQKKKICKCYNCGYEVMIIPDNVKEKTFGNNLEDAIIATYVECPVCGERILKQLDTTKTMEIADKGIKLEKIQISGRKLSPSQKKRLRSIEVMLYNTRKKLKNQYWDEIYQSLNQYEEEKTGTADSEPMQEDTGEPLRPMTSGERMNEHETE